MRRKGVTARTGGRTRAMGSEDFACGTWSCCNLKISRQPRGEGPPPAKVHKVPREVLRQPVLRPRPNHELEDPLADFDIFPTLTL